MLNLDEFELAPGALPPGDDDQDAGSARGSRLGRGSANASAKGGEANGGLSQGSTRRNGNAVLSQPPAEEEKKAGESKKRSLEEFQQQ